MGVRENKVETYLHREVCKLGGTTRKWVSPGRDGVPDRIVILRGTIAFVEVKTEDGRLSIRQSREVETLISHGAVVWVAYGKSHVDEFINWLKVVAV